MAWRENTILFVDDMLIAQMQGLARVPVAATRHPHNPIIGRTHPWEAGAVYIFGSVLRDPATGLYRMWYQAIDDQDAASPGHMTICYAESDDGVRWRKPLLPLVPYGHDHNTNIVLAHALYPGNPYCASVVLDQAAPAAELYKMMVWYEAWTDHLSPFNGAACFYSADGLRWQPYPAAQPAIKINVEVAGGAVQRYQGPNDANCVAPDRLQGEFVNWQVVRQYIPEGKQAFDRDLMAGSRLERVLAMQTSPDFTHWSAPRKVIVPSGADPDFVQFYSMGGFRYGNYWLGTLWVYYVHDQSMDLELAVSRDGCTWARPFPGHRLVTLGGDGDFDRGMLQSATGPVVVGDQIYIYYGGEDHRHDEAGGASIGLATLRLDRWAGLATGQRATLTTRPFPFTGSGLELNVYAHGGEVRSELLDEAGHVIPGYGLATAEPVVGDRTRHRLAWRGDSDLSSLTGRRLAVRFAILNATLYALSIVP